MHVPFSSITNPTNSLPSIVTVTTPSRTFGTVKVMLTSPSTTLSPVTTGVMVKSAFNTLNVSKSDDSVWLASPALVITIVYSPATKPEMVTLSSSIVMPSSIKLPSASYTLTVTSVLFSIA